MGAAYYSEKGEVLDLAEPVAPRARIFSSASLEDDDEGDVWEKDAENGFLSYSKMIYVKNMRQVRQQSSKQMQHH